MTKQLTRERLLVSISILVLMPFASLSQEPTAAPKHQKNFTKLHFVVTTGNGDEAEPVRDAEVFVKSADEDNPFDKTLRTDKNGEVTFTRVPRVKVLVQVTAAGFKTSGNNYDLEGESQRIDIKLEGNDGNQQDNIHLPADLAAIHVSSA